MRTAECPRNTLVRERPPVKMRKTRHRRYIGFRNSVARRPAVRRPVPRNNYPPRRIQWDQSYFRRLKFRVVRR